MNVLVVDDHPLIRSGIKSAILLEDNIGYVDEAANISEAISKFDNFKFDLAVLDLYLGKESAFNLIEILRKKNSEIKILILTSSMKKEDFQKAKKLKVEGYVLKEAYIEDIIYAMNVILRGKIFYDPDILEFSNDNTQSSLTNREYDVLIELGKGLPNLDIAKNLYISEHTVKKHISSILAKLELSNRTELALYAANISNI